MKKSIREWLKTLPAPYRKQALMNATLKPSRSMDIGTVSSLGAAINYAFHWGNTINIFLNQGHDYWEEIKSRADRGEFDVK